MLLEAGADPNLQDEFPRIHSVNDKLRSHGYIDTKFQGTTRQSVSEFINWLLSKCFSKISTKETESLMTC